MPVLLYRYMYRIGARTTFRHHARAEEALQHSSLIATEELTELLNIYLTIECNTKGGLGHVSQNIARLVSTIYLKL